MPTLFIKRNNPGNIRKDARWIWQGEKPGQVVGAYIEFDTLENGFRAMMKDVLNKVKAGTDTINKIITKYAPPGDKNPTAAYINFVSVRTGINKDTKIPVDLSTIGRIVEQMTYFEQSAGLEEKASEIQYLIRRAGETLRGVVAEKKKKSLQDLHSSLLCPSCGYLVPTNGR